MPCGDPTTHYRYEDGMRDVQRVRNELEPKLCHACKILEENGLMPAEIKWWWDMHQEQDRARSERDAKEAKRMADKQEREKYLASVRERLKSQLTAEELEALGIK